MCQSNLSTVPAPRTPKSPWRRFLRQPIRPRLSRKVATNGVRINLNRYWGKFEEVTGVQQNVLLFPAATTTQQHPTVPNTDDNNAINDNLANERTELIGNITQ